MIRSPRVLSLASAAALAMALGHSAVMAEESPAPAPEAPAAEAVPAPVAPSAPEAVIAEELVVTPVVEPEAAPAEEAVEPAAETTEPEAAESTPAPEPAAAESPRARAEALRAEMAAERNKRYQELRERAAEVGLELPETPPWESAEASLPSMPSHARPPAMRDIKSMTPEERRAAREARWREMRAIAAERGMELPETPPWVEAEERYKAAQERFEKYREIVDGMSKEQIEAARALFGRPPVSEMPRMQMPQMPQMQRPMGPRMGTRPGSMPYADRGMGQAPMGGYPQRGYPRSGYPQSAHPQSGYSRPGASAPMMSYPGPMDTDQVPPPPMGSRY